MPEDLQGTATEDCYCELPNYGPFVGRTLELTELEKFLHDGSSTAKSIIIVHGPRGVGKSALVREAARRVYEQKRFKTIFWFDRTRASELLFRDDSFEFGRKEKLDPVAIKNSEVYRFLRSFQSRKDDSKELPTEAVNFMRERLKDQPYLLIIDDFDEYDKLGDDPCLCEELARIIAPNKIILTTRLLEHSFSQPVYKQLRVGLLSDEEVRELSQECELDKANSFLGIPNLLLEEVFGVSLETGADYIWQISGGLPEFITRFLTPMSHKNPLLLTATPDTLEAFTDFAAGYIIQREQEKSPERYKTNYQENESVFLQRFNDWTSDEKYILQVLACQNKVQLLETKELAQVLGYRQEFQEYIKFYKALDNLHKARLIGCRIEGRVNKGKDKPLQSQVEKWILLPFAKEFIKTHLLNDEAAEAEFRRNQSDRWISFADGNPEFIRQIELQFEIINGCFLWCCNHHEWTRVVRLGKPLSQALWILQDKKHEFRPKLIDISQQTIQAAEQLENKDWQAIVDQWMVLAKLYYLYLELPNLALEYANNAVRQLEQVQANKTKVDEEKWIHSICLLAQIYLQSNQLEQAEHWLEIIENVGQVDAVSSDWLDSAFRIAHRHLSNRNWDQAQLWLEKVIYSVNENSYIEVAIRARLHLVRLYFARKDLEKTTSLINQIKKISQREIDPSREIVILFIHTLTLEAQIAYHSDNVEACKDSLKEAISIASGARLPIEDTLKGWLHYVEHRDRAFKPFDELFNIEFLEESIPNFEHTLENPVTFLGHPLDINGAVGLICPICRQEFQQEMLSQIWRCQHCNTYVHPECLREYGESCPYCGQIYESAR